MRVMPAVVLAMACVSAGAAGAASPAAAPADTALVFTRPLDVHDCIELGLRNNLPLRIARAELSRAHGTYVTSLAKFTPVVSGTASQQHQEDRLTPVDSTGVLPQVQTTSEL